MNILDEAKNIVDAGLRRGWIKKTYSNAGTYVRRKHIPMTPKHKANLSKALKDKHARRKAGLLSVLLLSSLQSFGSIEDSKAIRAIVGEAANQGRSGMLAVAGAIRNRGTLKGVYGVKNPACDKQPSWVWQRAREAWASSATNDITKGATHWEAVKTFGVPYWAKSLTITTNIGSHTFYK